MLIGKSRYFLWKSPCYLLDLQFIDHKPLFVSLKMVYLSILKLHLCAYHLSHHRWLKPLLFIWWLKSPSIQAELSEPVADLIVFEGFKAWKNGWINSRQRRKCVHYIGLNGTNRNRIVWFFHPEIPWSFLGFVQKWGYARENCVQVWDAGNPQMLVHFYFKKHVRHWVPSFVLRAISLIWFWETRPSGARRSWRSWTSSSGSGWRWPDRKENLLSVLSSYGYGPWIYHDIHMFRVPGCTLMAPWSYSWISVLPCREDVIAKFWLSCRISQG